MVRSEMSGWRIPLSSRRRPSSANTMAATAFRSSPPSGARTPSPKARTTAFRPSVRGATTSRATSSASMTGTAWARKRAATVLLPEAIPPVSPKRCTSRPAEGYTFTGPRMRDRAMGGKTSRRQLLRSAAGLAVVLLASGVAVGRTTGYEAPAGRRLLWMSPWQWSVVTHAARRVTAPDRDAGALAVPIPTSDEVEVAAFFDGWVARMPERLRRDLGRFLAYLEHMAPLSLGYLTRFTRLPPAAQDRVLASLEASSHDLLRAGFEGLKALVFIG